MAHVAHTKEYCGCISAKVLGTSVGSLSGPRTNPFLSVLTVSQNSSVVNRRVSALKI